MEFFATSEVEKVALFGGQDYWIQVKRDLNAGESRQLRNAAWRRASKPISMDGAQDDNKIDFELDLAQGAFEKVLLYLVDWNIPGLDGKTVDIVSTAKAKRDALKNLRPDVFDEIERAIDAYVLATAQEKKLPKPSSPLSVS